MVDYLDKCFFTNKKKNVYFSLIQSHRDSSYEWSQMFFVGEIRKIIEPVFVIGNCYCIYPKYLAHCRQNRLPHTIYWKSPILILGTSCSEI